VSDKLLAEERKKERKKERKNDNNNDNNNNNKKRCKHNKSPIMLKKTILK
jgi:hypothetical protein